MNAACTPYPYEHLQDTGADTTYWDWQSHHIRLVVDDNIFSHWTCIDVKPKINPWKSGHQQMEPNHLSYAPIEFLVLEGHLSISWGLRFYFISLILFPTLAMFCRNLVLSTVLRIIYRLRNILQESRPFCKLIEPCLTSKILGRNWGPFCKF